MAFQDVFIQRTSGQFQRRILATTALGSTSTHEVIYTPADGVETAIKKIYVCNADSSDCEIYLAHNENTATLAAWNLYSGITLTANRTLEITNPEIYMNNPNGAFMAGYSRAATETGALIVTLYGEEIQTRSR